MKTYRQQAIDTVKSWKKEYLSELIVRSHNDLNHEFIEVYPDGKVYDTEEPDNNTTHWVSYPSKSVEIIYQIHYESCEACNCDVCHMFREYDHLDEDEFLNVYGAEALSYCKSMTRDEAILSAAHDNGDYEEDIRDNILSTLENIHYGYFEDEDEVFVVIYRTSQRKYFALKPSSDDVARFKTEAEAKSFIEQMTLGCRKYIPNDDPHPANYHWYEILDDSKWTEEFGYEYPVYSSEKYYNDVNSDKLHRP